MASVQTYAAPVIISSAAAIISRSVFESVYQDAPMPTADLELSIQPAGDAYIATARLTPPGRQTTATLAEDVPVCLDRAALLEAALDPDEYGRRLTAMLFADQRLRDAWREARGFAHGAQSALRLRLDPADDLHSLYWETIRDPISDTPLARNQQVLLSRYLDSPDLTPIIIPDRADLTALAVIAAPTDLDQYGLAPINAAAEAARVTIALGDIPTTILAADGGQRATLAQLTAALHAGPSILYIVAHGSFVDGQPYLWLEQEDGRSDVVAGTELAQLIAGLSRRPLLIVLAACQGAGQSHNDQALAAVGPLLARAGVGAVIAMQGVVTMRSIELLMPPLFRELQQDGQIDRALATARSELRFSPDWWRPALFMRLEDGRLFTPPKPVVARPPGPPSWWERFRHHPLIFFPTVAVVVLSALLALVVGGIDAINGFPQAQDRLREWGVIDGIRPEQPGETLLIVAPFYHSEGVMDTEPHAKIRRAILQAAAETGLETLRVELASRTLRADDHVGAEQLAQRYDASIIVWGEDTGVEIVFPFRE